MRLPLGDGEVGTVVGGLMVVGTSGEGVGIADTPPIWLNPAKVSVQSLFGSCCLR